MNEPGRVTTDDQGASRPVFISYATADRKQALDICKAIERPVALNAGSLPETFGERLPAMGGS